MRAHREPVRVYYADTDAGGVLYHARALEFFERARTEALRASGLPHADLLAAHGRQFVVRRIEVEYLAPALLDDALTVETTALGVTAATAALRQALRRGDEILVTATVLLACIRRGGGAARIPPAWRQALAA